jgi:6-phosphogluconolactonase
MIRIYSDLDTLSHGAAELFVSRSQQAVQEKGRFAVALSGGHTPQRTYEHLSEPPFRDRVPWDAVHIFWGDERCVPTDHEASNERMTRQALLDHVPIPSSQVHAIRCAGRPREAAAAYEAGLRDFFGEKPPQLDLVFLGLGENGHTASLFPGTAVLKETQRWAAEVYVREQDLYRVTLTAPVLNQARVIAFMVTGAAKARVLKEVIESPPETLRFPAQLIRPTEGELEWLIDQEAARLLSREA